MEKSVSPDLIRIQDLQDSLGWYCLSGYCLKEVQIELVKKKLSTKIMNPFLLTFFI